jgi:UDP-3-O-[3-hydroxymyristoyl] glucosamine N-acyltransferase
MEFTAATIAGFLKGEIEGNPDTRVNTVAKIEEGHAGALSFLANLKYEEYLYTTGSSIVLVDKNFLLRKPTQTTLIRVENPYETFSQLLEIYQKNLIIPKGLEQPCFVHPTVEIDLETIYLGAFSYIGAQSKIGKNVKIYPQVYIGEQVEIQDNCIIYAGAKIYGETKIGKNCIIHSGAVIGSDGFGFVPTENGIYKKIPQIGNVILADNVEIGANTTIDRATMGSTHVGIGVKIDNLVQIAHNVNIGKNTVIAAQTGIAGSVKIGESCMFGGQVGISGHLTIADEVKIVAQSGISKSFLKKGAVIQGTPAMDNLSFNKSYVYFKKLPQLLGKKEE